MIGDTALPEWEGQTEIIARVGPDGVAGIGDAALAFGADFIRDGPDLVLSRPDAAPIRIVDYFRTLEPADLVSEDGAVLRGEIATRLAGPEAPGQFAQAGQAEATLPIGQVENVTGAARVLRSDGTAETLTPTSKIFLNDVLQTSDGSTLSVTFVDGTIFTLSANSRMVIDELIYAPDSNQNSATFDLVQGGFLFIAGQVARSGGMEVNTPAATMGIRGTTVLVDVEMQGSVATVEVTLTRDPNGDVGRVELFDLDQQLIADITTTDTKWIVSTDPSLTGEVARTAEDEASDNVLIAEAVAAYQAALIRFEQDGSFVLLDTLQRSSNSGELGADEVGTAQDEIDLNQQDAPIVPETQPAPPPAPANPPALEDGQQDSLLAPSLDVFKTAFEDSEGAPLAGSLSNDAQVAGAFVLVTGPENGSLDLNPDGTYTYTPAPDFNGLDGFTFEVTDAAGVTEQGSVSIEVLPVNDAPVIEDPGIGAGLLAVEDVITQVGGVLSATDVDTGDILTWSGSTGGIYGTFQISANGVWTYTLGDGAEALVDGDFVSETFTVTVTDTGGATDTQDLTISIVGADDTPMIVGGDLGADVVENDQTLVTGQLIVSDPDAGAVLSFEGSENGVFGDFLINQDGQWTYRPGELLETLGAGDTATESFTVTVTDETGASSTQDIVFNLQGVNDAPAAANVAFTVTGDTAFSDQLVAVDADVADAVSYALTGAGPANGTVVIGVDGSFTYTPEAGFDGFDSFEYIASDTNGGSRTGLVTLFVEPVNTPLPDGTEATLSFSLDPTEDAPAGQVQATVVPPPGATRINLAFALDSSASMVFSWEDQLEAVAQALESLITEFEGSASQVDVSIIRYSTNASNIGTFDLNDPDLIETVRDLEPEFGLTNWARALEVAEDFFDGQPVDETNLLYFISDGRPTSGGFNAVRDRLLDEATKGYSVQIEAFGLGDRIDFATLSDIDPDPVLLDSALDLVDAFDATALFNPTLVEFSVELVVDGVDFGEIADETAAGIVTEGFSATLPLADIAGLAGLLGDNNFFVVRATFDLDGDLSAGELTVNSGQVFEKRADAAVLEGNAASDLIFGSDLADIIDGNAGNDILVTFGGDDLITTGAGIDHVDAGAGDDRVILDAIAPYQPGFANKIAGGIGRDVLEIAIGGDLSVDVMPLVELSGIEALDLTNGAANQLDLSIDDLLSFSDEGDSELETLLGEALPESLTVYGDAGDTLTVTNGPSGEFVDTGTSVVDGDGTTLSVYTYVDGGSVVATLAVDSDVIVSGAAAPTG